MLYKTIVLQRLENSPMYRQLKESRSVLSTMERLSMDLKASHEHHKMHLAMAKPDSSPQQLASEATELALADLEAYLASLSPHTDQLDPSQPA